MAGDEEIYRDMKFKHELTMEERLQVSRLITDWTPAAERHKATTRLLFFACMVMIKTMGPAWCRIGYHTLKMYADETG
jgi:hypothetical protein